METAARGEHFDRMNIQLQINLKPLKLRIRSGKRNPAVGQKASRKDAFICSYPKSGNTWLRFLIANLLHPGGDVSFSTINQLVPDIYSLNVGKMAQLPTPRILKSHEAFRPDYRRVLYICRDPRDVLLSYYHFSRRERTIDDDLPMKDFARLFLDGGLQWQEIGTWAEHVGSWMGARQIDDRFCFLRYENLYADPVGELRRIAHILKIPATTKMLEGAVEASTANRMRSLEQSDTTAALGKNPRSDIPFVRVARPGGWREELDPEIAAEMETRWGSLMQQLGYLG
ncbi:MAG: sulfotransferase domain-containing protein [Parvibaculum sp.]|uniref:sulfotransferase domain-containing protein n=1 Tax=Parvibaculum sp. TaxID=2024848 RepID=UPI003C76B35E